MTDLWPIPATTRTLGARRPWKLQDLTTLGLCAVQLLIYTRICLIIIIIIPGTVCDFVLMCFLIFALTLYGHTKTAEQQTIHYTAIRWLVHWPLTSGLLHLVQRRGAWAGCGPAQSPPRCTKCNSPLINGQLMYHYSLWHGNWLCTLKS